MGTNRKVKACFYQVVDRGEYDPRFGITYDDTIGDQKIMAAYVPPLEAQFIEDHHRGGSLQYALALFYKLRATKINCYVAMTGGTGAEHRTKAGKHVSVLYERGGSWFVADPGDIVRSGVKSIDLYGIPSFYYLKKHGDIWLYDPYGENSNTEFFGKFLLKPEKII